MLALMTPGQRNFVVILVAMVIAGVIGGLAIKEGSDPMLVAAFGGIFVALVGGYLKFKSKLPGGE